MTDPSIGEADRGDTLADIDRALGPSLEPLIRRLCPGNDAIERRVIRKAVIEAVGDTIAEYAAPPPAAP